MKIVLAIVAILLLGFTVTYQFVEPAPPKTLKMATGREGGAYHHFALKYQKQLAQEKIQLEIQPTAGSIEALQQLKSGAVSVALIQGGTAMGSEFTEDLESLACLFYEPVWVFHRKELPVEYLFNLVGKRIAIGEVGSGIRALSLQLLQDNQVTAENSTFLEISSKEAAKRLIQGEIEAAFFVMSPTAELITQLLKEPTIELLSFKRHLAYAHHYSFLTSFTLGEGMIDLSHNIPATEKILLATTANLVARSDLHPDLTRLLLREVSKIHHPGGFLEKKGEFPNEKFAELPVNAGASHYLQYGASWLEKIFPFWIASKLDRLKVMLIPIIFMLLPILKGIIPLYRWQIRYKIFRWYADLREIERDIPKISQIDLIDREIARLKLLQHELIEVVSVPLSYMWELYLLRMHISLLLQRLEEQRLALSNNESQMLSHP
jgi:TRAP transporter TAXI family solute receptor